LTNTGNSIAAKIAIIAITTSNSIRVKPFGAVCILTFSPHCNISVLRWLAAADERIVSLLK